MLQVPTIEVGQVLRQGRGQEFPLSGTSSREMTAEKSTLVTSLIGVPTTRLAVRNGVSALVTVA
jgi:hypothetical protein